MITQNDFTPPCPGDSCPALRRISFTECCCIFASLRWFATVFRLWVQTVGSAAGVNRLDKQGLPRGEKESLVHLANLPARSEPGERAGLLPLKPSD